MHKIEIHPDRFKSLGKDNDAVFCFVTNNQYKENFNIIPTKSYAEHMMLTIDEHASFTDLLNERIPDNSHIVVIAPKSLFHSVDPALLGKRKLLIFACNSAPTSLDAVEHFLRNGEKTDPIEQQAMADRFFELAESTNKLKFVNREYGTELYFHHLSEDYGWHEQCGIVEWGQQQVFPPGEIACFLVPLKDQKIDDMQRFEMNGNIAIKGFPVLHSGPPSFLLNDQERIYQKLKTIDKEAIIATVKRGEIQDINTTGKNCYAAYDMLSKMFEVDSRYRIIYEIGFSLNYHVQPYPANSAMNEVSAKSSAGSIHYGIGMLPFTQYHLDITCPDTVVIGDNEQTIFSDKTSKITRHKTSQCPCLGD